MVASSVSIIGCVGGVRIELLLFLDDDDGRDDDVAK